MSRTMQPPESSEMVSDMRLLTRIALMPSRLPDADRFSRKKAELLTQLKLPVTIEVGKAFLDGKVEFTTPEAQGMYEMLLSWRNRNRHVMRQTKKRYLQRSKSLATA